MKNFHRRLIIHETKLYWRRRTTPHVRHHPAAQRMSTGCIRQGDQQYRVDEPMSRIRVSSQRIVFLEKQIERAGRESRRRVVSHVMLSLTASSHNIFFHASYNPGDRKRSDCFRRRAPSLPKPLDGDSTDELVA